jgi:hypothetical protein
MMMMSREEEEEKHSSVLCFAIAVETRVKD